jgi:hypothetical protein
MKAATVEIAVIKTRQRAETPASLYVAGLSFASGAALIFLTVVRWLLAQLGGDYRESSSLFIVLIGFGLFALGGHCLDVYETADRINR